MTLGYKAKKCACIGAPPPEHKYGSASVETDRADDVSTCPNTNTIPTKVRRTMIVISESEDGPGASQRSSVDIAATVRSNTQDSRLERLCGARV